MGLTISKTTNEAGSYVKIMKILENMNSADFIENIADIDADSFGENLYRTKQLFADMFTYIKTLQEYIGITLDDYEEFKKAYNEIKLAFDSNRDVPDASLIPFMTIYKNRRNIINTLFGFTGNVKKGVIIFDATYSIIHILHDYVQEYTRLATGKGNVSFNLAVGIGQEYHQMFHPFEEYSNLIYNKHSTNIIMSFDAETEGGGFGGVFSSDSYRNSIENYTRCILKDPTVTILMETPVFKHIKYADKSRSIDCMFFKVDFERLVEHILFQAMPLDIITTKIVTCTIRHENCIKYVLLNPDSVVVNKFDYYIYTHGPPFCKSGCSCKSDLFYTINLSTLRKYFKAPVLSSENIGDISLAKSPVCMDQKYIDKKICIKDSIGGGKQVNDMVFALSLMYNSTTKKN